MNYQELFSEFHQLVKRSSDYLSEEQQSGLIQIIDHPKSR